jgi:hypothetical protein
MDNKLLELCMRQGEQRSSDNATRSELSEQFARLEQRVRVLERIVTDGNADLKRQFRDLGE